MTLNHDGMTAAAAAAAAAAGRLVCSDGGSNAPRSPPRS